MQTDTLIASLAGNARPVSRRAVGRRLTFGVLAGALVTAAIVVMMLGLRYDLPTAVHGPTIWMKWGYTASLALVGLVAARHLARPEARSARMLWLAAAPIVALAIIASLQMIATPRADWMALWMGHSARECPIRVTILSLPIFAGLLWSFRRLAPTRLRLAGAAAGLSSGAIGATLYGFACPETSALFVVTWYTLGIAIATAIGALVGPRLLRW